MLRFGVFELDSRSGELRKNGVEIRLAGQPLQILLLLLERRGEIVTRDDLRQKLWSSDTFVDFDVGLSSAVKKLRDALGDSADNPRFIQTLPRRGYRFIAPVESARDADAVQTASPPPPKAPVKTIAIASALAFILIVATIFFFRRDVATRREREAAVRIRSIAVLPFDNLTGDPSQDYLVDGITDGLTTDLAQVDGLRVISRTSAMQYRHTKKHLPQIAQELNVDAVVEGSVTRAAQQLRISAQLIDAATDRHLWAHKYEGEMRDAFGLETEIAGAVSAAVGPRQTAAVRRVPARHQNIQPDAYDAYLKGIFAAGRRTADGNKNAIVYFDEAIAKQPDCAICYAALANTHLQFLYAGPFSPLETVPKAEAAARRALQLDDSLAIAHRTLGSILHNFYWRWEDGDKEMRRALQLDPNSVDAHRSAALALIRTGRFQEAMGEVQQARELDPLAFDSMLTLGAAFRTMGQYDRAIAEIQRALRVDPNIPRAHFQLGVTYVFMNRLNDAITEFETADRLAPNARFQSYLGYAYAAAGRKGEARKIVSALESRAKQQYISSFGIALVYDALGEPDRAAAALERAYQEHAVEFAQANQYPRFRLLASDPRYTAVMRRVSGQRPVVAY